MIIDEDIIKQETMVAVVEWFETLPSTNDHAMSRTAGDDCPKPLLVIAHQQTTGRGRGANRWWSEEGALTFSLVVQSDSNKLPPPISLAVGVAVCNALRKVCGDLDVGLKWPNDVFLGGRKLGGILVERPSSSGDFVIGVGLNLNNSMASAPSEISNIAASLIDATNRPCDLQHILINVLQEIEQAIAALQSDPKRLHDDWQTLCILTGRNIVVDVADRAYEGVCEGIDDDGALLINTASGVERCTTGVVRSFSTVQS